VQHVWGGVIRTYTPETDEEKSHESALNSSYIMVTPYICVLDYF